MVEKRIKNVRALLARYRKRLQTKVRVEKMILFGSYARGAPRDYSDIDVAVISQDFRGGTMSDCLLLERAAREITSLIEPFAFTPKDVRRRRRGDFLDHILKTGKVVYSS